MQIGELVHQVGEEAVMSQRSYTGPSPHKELKYFTSVYFFFLDSFNK